MNLRPLYNKNIYLKFNLGLTKTITGNEYDFNFIFMRLKHAE